MWHGAPTRYKSNAAHVNAVGSFQVPNDRCARLFRSPRVRTKRWRGKRNLPVCAHCSGPQGADTWDATIPNLGRVVIGRLNAGQHRRPSAVPVSRRHRRRRSPALVALVARRPRRRPRRRAPSPSLNTRSFSPHSFRSIMKNGFKTVRLGHALATHQRKRDGKSTPSYYDVKRTYRSQSLNTLAPEEIHIGSCRRDGSEERVSVEMSVAADHFTQIVRPGASTKARRKDRSLTPASLSLSAGTLLA